MRFLKWLLIVVIILGIIYLLGPSPDTPVYTTVMPAVLSNAAALENYVSSNEAQHKLKPNNQARIVWANDSLKQKTEYAIVYLHGYSASQEEGKPIHTNIAKEFGCNLYLSRLAEHGIDTIDPMINLTAEEYWESAKQALAIGKQLGNKVILMGTSTGGTNALQLAATFPNDIIALVLMSPNIAINNSNAYLLNNPWGLQLAKLITGDAYVNSKDQRPIFKEYWYSHYPLQSTVQLQEMLETTMTKETFEKVKQPVLMLYYYKDEVHQDSVVSVPAMLNMFAQLGSQTKIKQAVPNAGDHVMGSYIKSKDLLSVQRAIENFMQKTLKLPRVSEGEITESYVPENK
ncbi:MAG TPA: alpha/beta hydrolase [Panacibacter sp.]|nr:alpha/beta hydrolase [Panacibacter sp.]